MENDNNCNCKAELDRLDESLIELQQQVYITPAVIERAVSGLKWIVLGIFVCQVFVAVQVHLLAKDLLQGVPL